jgi:hypothetical protein
MNIQKTTTVTLDVWGKFTITGDEFLPKLVRRSVTAYHLNQFQRNTDLLGDSLNGDLTVLGTPSNTSNIDRSTDIPKLYHKTISNNYSVKTILTQYFRVATDR